MFDSLNPFLRSDRGHRTGRIRNGVRTQRLRTSRRLARALHLGPPRGEVG